MCQESFNDVCADLYVLVRMLPKPSTQEDHTCTQNQVLVTLMVEQDHHS